MLRFFLLSILLLCLCLIKSCLARDYVVPYDNVPITAKKWEQIDIKWSNGYGKLLRPIAYAHRHHLVLGQQRYFNLSEFGIPKAKITVTHIGRLSKSQIHQLIHGRRPVIGIYIHRTMDVRTYRFTDKHGHITAIHATPNHPFYVANLHSYLPINQITDTMALESKQHQQIHLVCLNRHQHCGIPYQPNKAKIVYNLEVYQKHCFRVSHAEIKVHNSNKSLYLNDAHNDNRQLIYNYITTALDDPVGQGGKGKFLQGQIKVTLEPETVNQWERLIDNNNLFYSRPSTHEHMTRAFNLAPNKYLSSDIKLFRTVLVGINKNDNTLLIKPESFGMLTLKEKILHSLSSIKSKISRGANRNMQGNYSEKLGQPYIIDQLDERMNLSTRMNRS